MKNEYRTAFLREIFNVDDNGNKTTRSLYYQCILRYFLKDPNQFAKVREVANWLIDIVPLRTKKASNESGSKSEIVENREKTFRKYFGDLSSWNLISSRKTIGQKGNVSTYEFKLTNFGNLLALLIETEFAEHKEKAYDQLYQYLQSYFMNQSYSLDEFCISYFEKSKDSKLFGLFVEHLRKNLIYHNYYVSNDNDLFTQSILLTTDIKAINKKLWKLWKKSFDELAPENMRLLQHHLKLVLGRMIERKIKNYDRYLRVVFDARADFGKIVTEVYCSECDDDVAYQYETVSVLTYLRAVFYDVKALSKSFRYLTCKNCGKSKISFTIF